MTRELYQDLCNTDVDDIKQAYQYLCDNIPCREFEQTCGMYIGCMECPYNHFRATMLAAFDVIIHNENARKLFENSSIWNDEYQKDLIKRSETT